MCIPHGKTNHLYGSFRKRNVRNSNLYNSPVLFIVDNSSPSTERPIYLASLLLYHIFYIPLILIIISKDSYFLKMILLFNFVGTLTEAKMGVGRITFPSKGSMRGQYVFFSANYELCRDIFYFNIFADGLLFL